MSTLHTFLVVVLSLSWAKGTIFEDIGHSIAAPDHTIFRRDYKFHTAANGWLKLHRVPSSWNIARQLCDLEGARLASPNNEGLYSELRMLLQSNHIKSIFTGVHTMTTGNDYFSEEGVHIDDMPVQWADNEPDNSYNQEKCMALMAPDAMADVKCDSRHAFVCYRQKNGTESVNECGNNEYTKHGASCYKVHSVRSTWDEAHTICTAEGGHLVIINSDEEAKILKNLMNIAGFTYINVYIGLYNWARYNGDAYTRWLTLDGKTPSEAGFRTWQKGEPNNNGGNEYCASIVQKENTPIELNDINCDSLMPFICEIEIAK